MKRLIISAIFGLLVVNEAYSSSEEKEILVKSSISKTVTPQQQEAHNADEEMDPLFYMLGTILICKILYG